MSKTATDIAIGPLFLRKESLATSPFLLDTLHRCRPTFDGAAKLPVFDILLQQALMAVLLAFSSGAWLLLGAV